MKSEICEGRGVFLPAGGNTSILAEPFGGLVCYRQQTAIYMRGAPL
jgi:hypothetical protein